MQAVQRLTRDKEARAVEDAVVDRLTIRLDSDEAYSDDPIPRAAKNALCAIPESANINMNGLDKISKD